MFEALLDTALDIGITENDYWNMTLGEVARAIRSYNRLRQEEQREKAAYIYRLADLITAGVSCLFDEKAAFPKIYDAFPGVFGEVEKLAKEEEQKQAAELYKAKMLEFVDTHNRRWGEAHDA